MDRNRVERCMEQNIPPWPAHWSKYSVSPLLTPSWKFVSSQKRHKSSRPARHTRNPMNHRNAEAGVAVG